MKKLLAVLLFAPAMAYAEFHTGNSLLAKMNSTDQMDKALAIGYVMGVADAGYGTNHCPPTNVTAGQLVDLTKQVITASPATRNFSADLLIYYTFKNTWPCKNKVGT